jgi:hypothetical protein
MRGNAGDVHGPGGDVEEEQDELGHQPLDLSGIDPARFQIAVNQQKPLSIVTRRSVRTSSRESREFR